MYKWILDKTDTVRELLLLYLAIIMLAAGAFSFTEGIKFHDGVWLAFVTATSTGYGDFYPKSEAGRCVAVVLMHATLFFIIPLVVVRLMGLFIEDKHQFSHEEQEEIKRKLDALLESKNAQM